MPSPALACEIGPRGVAAARGARRRVSLEAHAFEALPDGAVTPSPVEPNILDAVAVRGALERVLGRVNGHEAEAALVVPDQVVRVFLLQFDTFPRRAEEAIPLLRWRLKKSVPFDVEDTVVSYMLQEGGPAASGQTGAEGGSVHVLAAVARQRIVRQYEELLEGAGRSAGVVISSTLAALPLVDDFTPSLLARLAGRTLTTIIVRRGVLAVYRCTEMQAEADALAPQSLLDEIYPAAAYYHDNWGEPVGQARLAGFGSRYEEFRAAVERELGCKAASLSASAALEERLAGEERATVDREFDALVGWMLYREN
jgi:type IV pilus assembly protein PilM